MENFNEFDQVGNAPERSTGAIISHAFEIFKNVFGWGILMIVLVAITSSVISGISEAVSGYDSQAMGEQIKEMIQTKNYDLEAITSADGVMMASLLSFLGGILLYPMYAGFLYVVQKSHTGQRITFSDLFIGYKQNTVQIFLYGLLSGIITYIAFMLCFLPAIFISPLLMIGLPIVFFENTSAVDAIKKSFSIGSKNYGTFLGTGILAFLISVAGVFLCGIGILISFPFMFVAMYSAYIAFCGTPRVLKTES